MTTAREIAEKIEALIASGADGYLHGDRLLSVRDLGAQEGVSAQTASAAYVILEAFGQVRVSKKSGTWVTGSKTTWIHLGSFNEPPDWTKPTWSVKDENSVQESDLYRVSVSEAHGLAEHGIPDGTRVAERHYRKTVDGAPVQHKVTVLPYDLALLMPRDADYNGPAPMMSPVGHPIIKQPLGMTMSTWLGWDIDRYYTTFGTEKLSEDASEVFGVPAGTPMSGSFCVAKRDSGETVFVVVTTHGPNAKFTIDHK